VTIQKPPANRATPVSRPILRRRSQFIIVYTELAAKTRAQA
jgi:hypothetical protein